MAKNTKPKDVQKSTRRFYRRFAIAAILVVSMYGLVFAFGNSGISAQSESFEEDIVATSACEHFNNVYIDAADGVLSDTELRKKIQEVNETASASTVPEIRTAARDVLSSLTTGTTDTAVTAMTKMLSECNSYKTEVGKAVAANNDVKDDSNTKKSDSEKDSDCFVATAAYGTHLTHDLDVLRDFRDDNLKTNAVGNSFVAGYYKAGPIAADFIEDKPILRGYIREFHIKPVVRLIELIK
jgi:hypothetical protein